MTGLKQVIADLKLHVSTDKRIWSAGGFVCIVFFVWFTTGSWREPDPEPPEEMVRIRVHDERISSMVDEFNKDMREANEERQVLKDYLSRVTQQIEVEKQEIDWHVDILVNKLNDMTEKVDDITNKVGASAIHTAQFEEKLKRQKARQQKKKPVDRSNL